MSRRAASFLDFARALHVSLTPAQEVFGAIAFDGANPQDFTGQRRDLARSLFGDIEVIPDEARDVAVALAGARAGKSYVFCALRLLHLALIADLSTMAPGELAAALIVAPDLRLARQTLRYALGAAKSEPSIAALIASESADGFVLRREGGRTVSLECLPATRGGSAVRGRSLVGAVLDECAFFRDDSYTVNDVEVFRAIAPRIMPSGQLIVASTPWAEAGLLFELWRDNFGKPTTALVAHAPTTLLRNDPRTIAMVERERERDAENARREFDAAFMSAGSGLFFNSAAIDRCVDDDLIIPATARRTSNTFGAADFGFVSDASVVAIAERREAEVFLLALEEQRPQQGAPLRPSAVVADFATVVRHYKLREIMSDGHYAEAIREHLKEHGLRLRSAPEGQSGKVETYVEVRRLVNEHALRIPRHQRLIAQLKGITVRPTSGGGLQISSPRQAGGGHGDCASAAILAIYQASRSTRVQRDDSASAPWREVLSSVAVGYGAPGFGF
jgi:hypothetical protein